MNNLESCMPHRAPMLLLDELEAWSPDGARAWLVLRDANPFMRANGILERAAYAELLAQCFAAGAGASLQDRGEAPPSLGYLAALRDVHVVADARVGQRLCVEVRVTARLGRIAVAEGEVRCGEHLLAQGQVKVYLPDT